MINTVLYSYLIGWIITSVGLALATRDRSRPASVIVAAGAVWPLLVLGAAQFAAVALVAEIVRRRGQGQKSIADELDELLDEWLDSPDADPHYRRSTVLSEPRNFLPPMPAGARRTTVPLAAADHAGITGEHI